MEETGVDGLRAGQRVGVFRLLLVWWPVRW